MSKIDRESLLKEMRDSVGVQEPITFFKKMVDVFELLFNHIDQLECEVRKANKKASVKATLAVQWEPKVAAALIFDMIEDLRHDRETYHLELSKLKKAYVEDQVTQNYNDFCQFWEETLGWHPFVDYK